MPAVPIIGAGASLVGGLINRRKGANQSQTSEGSFNRTDTQNLAFDPTALGAYQGLQPQIAGTLGDFMSDPWNAGYFQKALTRVNEGIGARAQTSIRNLMSPTLGVMGQSGGGVGTGTIANPNAFMASQLSRIGRSASREKAEALTSLLLGAQGLRFNAANAAMGYRPLQTGSTTTSQGTERRSGTTNSSQGSWLGDILGTGGAILGGLGGGGGIGPFYSAQPRPMQNIFNQPVPWYVR